MDVLTSIAGQKGLPRYFSQAFATISKMGRGRLDFRLPDGRTFRAEGMQVPGLAAADGPVTLGFRAEDASVVAEGGNITAPVYSMELLGDATLVSLRIGERHFLYPAPCLGKNWRLRTPIAQIRHFEYVFMLLLMQIEFINSIDLTRTSKLICTVAQQASQT